MNRYNENPTQYLSAFMIEGNHENPSQVVQELNSRSSDSSRVAVAPAVVPVAVVCLDFTTLLTSGH